MKKDFNRKPVWLPGTSKIGVLFFHGWTALPEELEPLGKFLNSSGYAFSAPLLKGHGTKPEDLKDITWADWREGAQKALAELEKHCSQIFVGGVSIGGDIAMLLAEEKSVAGVIPLGAAVKYKLHSPAKLALKLMGIGKTYRKKYYPPWVRKFTAEREVYPYYPISSAKEVLRLADATRKYLPCVTKPILVMQSTSDHMVPKRSPGMILKKVRSAEKEIFWVKKAYHVFVEDKQVWAKIKEFIEKVTNK